MKPQDWTVTGIADRVRHAELSAVRVLELCLERLAVRNPAINAFVHVGEELARRDAGRVDACIGRGEDPGPLAGVPIGIKDIFESVAGMPTTDGSLLRKGNPPDEVDSPHVARLRAAGAVIVGRTATPEFGADSATHSRAWGVTRNPWNLQRTPGGSSGGSAAAVAAGIVPLASASDGGGSTRSPASYCNLVGLKASMGRVPRTTGSNNVTVLGGLTKTVRDTARYLDVVAGPHDRDRMTLPPPRVNYEQIIESLEVGGLRAVFSSDIGYVPVDPEIAALTDQAAAELISIAGLRRVDIPVVLTNFFPGLIRISRDQLRQALIASGDIPARQHLLGPKMRKAMADAEGVSPQEVLRERAGIDRLEGEVAALFENVDLVLTPVTTVLPYGAADEPPASVAGRDLSGIGAENFPLWANVTWNPSISVPAGFSRSGLPIGLQITARRHRDDIVLRLARIWERARPWPLEAPGFA